jgi:hypothetical protein
MGQGIREFRKEHRGNDEEAKSSPGDHDKS